LTKHMYKLLPLVFFALFEWCVFLKNTPALFERCHAVRNTTYQICCKTVCSAKPIPKAFFWKGTPHKVASQCVLGMLQTHCIASYCNALHCITWYCIMFCCIALYCMLLHCSVVYCSVLCRIILYCIVMYRVASPCILLNCIVSHGMNLYICRC